MPLTLCKPHAAAVLTSLRDQLMEEQAAFARRRSVSQAEKVARNTQVQRQKAAIDLAVSLLVGGAE